jgi:ATP synthase protein I
VLPESRDVYLAPRVRLIPPLKTKPIRTVLRWQVIATAAMALLAGALVGWHGALSAALGGFVNVSAGVVYALLLGLGLDAAQKANIGMSLTTMFRAEGGKILLIIGQLWLVLSLYKDIVTWAFFSAFVLTVIIFSMAIAVRD